MDLIAARSFNALFIILDIIWLLLFCGLLWITKRRIALVVGGIAGIIYLIHTAVMRRDYLGKQPANTL